MACSPRRQPVQRWFRPPAVHLQQAPPAIRHCRRHCRCCRCCPSRTLPPPPCWHAAVASSMVRQGHAPQQAPPAPPAAHADTKQAKQKKKRRQKKQQAAGGTAAAQRAHLLLQARLAPLALPLRAALPRGSPRQLLRGSALPRLRAALPLPCLPRPTSPGVAAPRSGGAASGGAASGGAASPGSWMRRERSLCSCSVAGASGHEPGRAWGALRGIGRAWVALIVQCVQSKACGQSILRGCGRAGTQEGEQAQAGGAPRAALGAGGSVWRRRWGLPAGADSLQCERAACGCACV